MKRLFVGGIAIAMLVVTVGNVWALPTLNNSFESGDLAEWSSVIALGNTEVVTSVTAVSGEEYQATDGEYFAMLSGTFIIWTDISWEMGDQLSFDWAFLSGDSKGHNDFSVVALVNTDPWEFDVNLLSDTVAIGTHGDTGWQSYTFDAMSIAGDGSLGFAVVDNGGVLGSYLHPSYLLVDNVQITSPVPTPEPASIILFASGLSLLGGAINKKMSAV